MRFRPNEQALIYKVSQWEGGKMSKYENRGEQDHFLIS